MRMVRVQNIRDGMELALDIPAGNVSSPPLLRRGVRLSRGVATRLHGMNVRAVWIEDSLGEGIHPVQILPPEVRESAERASADCLAGAKKALATHRGIGSVIFDRIKDAVSDMTEVLLGCPPAACALDDLAGADSYTHTHSVRVAALGIMLADHVMRADGWTDWTGRRRFDRLRERLVDIGTGLLIHDIGKIAVPGEILNKPERLTAEEFALIKAHPTAGLSLLEGADLSPLTLSVVRDHHERWDGEGYPAGKPGADLHLFPRIASVADTFDAVTAERPYMPARAPHIGCTIIRAGAGSQFDPRIARRFSEVVMPYPIGQSVEMPGGGDGVVVDIDPTHPDWPLLRYHDTAGERVERRRRIEEGVVQDAETGAPPWPASWSSGRSASALL